MVAIDPTIVEKIVKEYVTGKPITQLAKEYGFGTTSIWRWVKKAGVNRSESETKQLLTYTQEYRDWCVAEYVSGKPSTQIEKESEGKVCADTVMKWVHKAGVARTHGATKRLKKIDQKWECIDLYNSGMSIPQVSVKTGKHWNVIHTWLKEEGYNRPLKEGKLEVVNYPTLLTRGWGLKSKNPSDLICYHKDMQ